jgi:hypothetical protein
MPSFVREPFRALALKLLRRAAASQACRAIAVSSLNDVFDLHTEL